MNLANWTRFYKYNNLDRVDQNAVYTPYISPDRDVYCMDFSNASTLFFNNEVTWLEHVQNEPYAPELLDIDKQNKYITFKWYDTSVNHLIFNHKFTQQSQAQDTLHLLEKQNILKLNFVPHTCYIDNENNLRVHDFYACASANAPLIEMEKIAGVMSGVTKYYYEQHSVDGMVSLKNVYIDAIRQNRGGWPECLSTTFLTY